MKNSNITRLVDIVVVNWNSGRQLTDVISSVELCHANLVNSVIIVDNASTDDSINLVEMQASGLPFMLRVIRNSDNLGFGAACNQGAAHATAEFLLFLNPDTRLFNASLSTPVEFMQRIENAKVGVAGIQLEDNSGHISRSCSRFPGAMVLIAHATGLSRFPGFSKMALHMSDWAHDKTQTVDHVIGAFYLIRRALFESLQGFDENFFVYLEDLDLSLRVKQAGYRSVFLAEAQAFHAGGGTSQQVKAHRLFYFLRSRLLYAFKHFSWMAAVGVLTVTLLVEPFSRSALALLRRSWPNFKETWAAYGMLWRWLPQWIFKGTTR